MLDPDLHHQLSNGARLSVYTDQWCGTLFSTTALHRGLTAQYTREWFTDGAVDIKFPDVVASKTSSGRRELVISSKEGLVLAHLVLDKSGRCWCAAVAQTPEDAEKFVSEIQARAPDRTTGQNKVTTQFWFRGPRGAESMSREIEVPTWSDVRENYTSEVQRRLDPWMDIKFRPPSGGRLALWRGCPGTGKTWSLRALMSQWKSWCTFHYITDPEQFFGSNADYMLNVLLQSTDEDLIEEEDEGKWRLLILEDTGEMLTPDAKQQTGQALSRLLNVVDGLIGQGLKIMVLITTNEDIGKLHPAVVRPGRCIMDLEFKELSASEALAWAQVHGVEHPGQTRKLAELYALTQGVEVKEEVKLGFVRGD